MTEKWISHMIKADFNKLGQHFQIDPLTARLLVNRGVVKEKQIEKYLNGSLKDLHSPWLFKQMEEAVELLLTNSESKVAIASDFDCDGIFSAYILEQGLQKVGIQSRLYTPERVAEGYGLNRRIVDEAVADGCRILLTCDNGIAAIEEVEYAKNSDMTVIVTDHHEVQDELPQADAIVNHKQTDCAYPFKGLCGASVAFKLIQALYEKKGIAAEQAEELLAYVAIATVADVMDLNDENRILVREGLKRLSKSDNVGLQALLQVQNLQDKKITAHHLGFVLGPCFNASGRLRTVDLAFDLLHCNDSKEAVRLASKLKDLNDKRKEMTESSVHTAYEQIDRDGLDKQMVMVITLADCHESLVGIVAGRIKEKYHHPVIVFTETEDGMLKGSGRSIEAYHMFDRLMECKDLLVRFGGHKMAAGMTVKKENIGDLIRRLNAESGLTKEDLRLVVKIDAMMPLQYIREDLILEWSRLEPFGKGNPKPLFAEKHFSICRAIRRGRLGNVLSMRVKNQSGIEMDAIMFNEIDAFENELRLRFGEAEIEKMYRGRKNSIDIGFAYYPVIDEYNGYRRIQIQISHYCCFS